MSALITMGLVVSVLLVLGYIIGTELCLPSARHAVRTGDTELWRLACRLVAMGEWAIIALCASLLMLLEHNWQLFTSPVAGGLLGLSAAGAIAGGVVWELAGHARRHYARTLATSLDLVLPAHGSRRERFEDLRQGLESGSFAEQQRALQALLAQHPVPDG